MHRAVAQLHFAFGPIGPGQRMLHPAFIITLREILPRMGPAAFLPRQCTFNGNRRLHNEVVIFQRFNQIAVPDQRTVRHADIIGCLPDIADLLHTLA